MKKRSRRGGASLGRAGLGVAGRGWARQVKVRQGKASKPGKETNNVRDNGEAVETPDGGSDAKDNADRSNRYHVRSLPGGQSNPTGGTSKTLFRTGQYQAYWHTGIKHYQLLICTQHKQRTKTPTRQT